MDIVFIVVLGSSLFKSFKKFIFDGFWDSVFFFDLDLPFSWQYAQSKTPMSPKS